jgi:hypothetical protein
MNLKEFWTTYAPSHQNVFQLEQEQLVSVSFTNGDELLEFEGENHACSGDRQAHMIVIAIGIQDVLFNIFTHQKTDSLQKLTHILRDLSSIHRQDKFSPFTIEGEARVGGEDGGVQMFYF